MSGKAKLASKNAGKRERCPAHGSACDFPGGHAARAVTRVLEFRRTAKGALAPKLRWAAIDGA